MANDPAPAPAASSESAGAGDRWAAVAGFLGVVGGGIAFGVAGRLSRIAVGSGLAVGMVGGRLLLTSSAYE